MDDHEARRGWLRVLRGEEAEEAGYSLRDYLGEACGLAAAVGLSEASRFVYDCLMLQEHRGEQGAGIVSVLESGRYALRRHLGSVRESFRGVDFSSCLGGCVAIGHNRYATHGAHEEIANVQPLFFQASRFGSFALAHNGQIYDPRGVRARLIREGVIFQTTADSEILGHLIAQSSAQTLEEAIIEATREITMAYSLLVLCGEKVIALRDRYGVRPLSFGRLGAGYLVASENAALDQFPACHAIEDIAAGEMVILTPDGAERRRYAQASEHFCIFEGMYFSDPRSRYRGIWHEDFRFALGKALVQDAPQLSGQMVIPVLDSGKHAALGLASALGLPYVEAFKRQHNPPRAKRRSFTAASEGERVHTAYQKLHLRGDLVRGKRVIVVDDSMVRSTTMRTIIERLRAAEAAEVTICIAAPPIVDICPLGMDFQRREELIAYRRDTESIRREIGADHLYYLRLPSLLAVVKETYSCGVCHGCLGGAYPCD
jgi:amidophosphoribosyltransferase